MSLKVKYWKSKAKHLSVNKTSPGKSGSENFQNFFTPKNCGLYRAGAGAGAAILTIAGAGAGAGSKWNSSMGSQFPEIKNSGLEMGKI